ncbi:hypothetical protein [uncultured Sneathia sp.]|uniref:hypothetical protein n=1 Tax=uncultured Sneathia sp. TaxID=278067 RepID=UPI002599E81D|nr:hypothetical protein [uncultured Sneathia sp.]
MNKKEFHGEVNKFINYMYELDINARDKMIVNYENQLDKYIESYMKNKNVESYVIDTIYSYAKSNRQNMIMRMGVYEMINCDE